MVSELVFAHHTKMIVDTAEANPQIQKQVYVEAASQNTALT